MFNALTFDDEITSRKGYEKFSKIFYAGDACISSPAVVCFRRIYDGYDGDVSGNVYLESLDINDDLLDRVISNYLSGGGELILNLSGTLDEVGTCDSRYGCSPVFYADRLGLLENAYVAGAVYLDRDDIDIINQRRAEIILTPSATMGKGLGIPPARMMDTLGARVHLGTGLVEFNPDADLIFERKLLSFAVNGALCTENALSEKLLYNLLYGQ